jgi:hypothetical protein
MLGDLSEKKIKLPNERMNKQLTLRKVKIINNIFQIIILSKP